VFSFIAAHSAFWALGIFNSMGLNRVLVTIFPLCGIMAIQGLHAITNAKKNLAYKDRIAFFFLLGILIFPLLKNPASTNFRESIFRNKQHLFLSSTLIPYLEKNHPNKNYYSSETEIGLFTGKDIFKQKLWLYPGAKVPPQNMQTGDVFIFDSWLMASERNISLAQIRLGSDLHEDTVFSLINNQNKVTQFHLFVKP
jgi:hypothetical protein